MMNGIYNKVAVGNELTHEEASYLSKLDVNEDGTIDVRDVSEFYVYRKFITKCTANGISEEMAKQVVLSDFDNNNIIDSNDGQILLEILVHLKEPSEGIKYDINGDGNIDILDVSKFNINLNEISSKFNNN